MWKMRALNPPRVGTEAVIEINMGKARNIGTTLQSRNKMKPTNPNAHTYVNGTDVKTHGYAVTHNTFLQ